MVAIRKRQKQIVARSFANKPTKRVEPYLSSIRWMAPTSKGKATPKIAAANAKTKSLAHVSHIMVTSVLLNRPVGFVFRTKV